MIIQHALQWATTQLSQKKITTASLDAEVLLSYVLKKPKEYLFAHSDAAVPPQKLQQYKKLMNRRRAFEPIAYLTGHKEFYGLDFTVDHTVLIPRPETELLVDTAIAAAKKMKKKQLTIADIGTGSGCIAISIATRVPRATLLATDSSVKSLRVAKQNAKKHRANIRFFLGDLLTPIKNKKIDIIVANLPYLPTNHHYTKIYGLQYEPKSALYSGHFGLRHYENFFDQIIQYSILPYVIIGEIDPGQSKKITQIIKKMFPNASCQIMKDLAARDRIFIIRNFKK